MPMGSKEECFQLNRINPSGGAYGLEGVAQNYCFQLNRINPSGGEKIQKEEETKYISFQLNRINPSGGVLYSQQN